MMSVSCDYYVIIKTPALVHAQLASVTAGIFYNVSIRGVTVCACLHSRLFLGSHIICIMQLCSTVHNNIHMHAPSFKRFFLLVDVDVCIVAMSAYLRLNISETGR